MESFNVPSGSIEVIFGPMFSGKSTELLRRIRRQTIANKKCLVIKYQGDTRYSVEKMSTHDHQMWAAVPCDKLENVQLDCLQFDVIGVDEGQFFPDIVSFCETMANLGKIVIVAALDGTFQRRPFGSVLELIPLAENVTKLHAVCMICYQDAAFSKRMTSSTEVQLIGGAESYISVCRTCYAKSSIAMANQQQGQSTNCLTSPPTSPVRQTGVCRS
ncbi:hypothetical protein DFA_12272 [Cavenderia fasciculata]|uniref:Thymidine kinase n=1 Tax=Cavenderia fasciculata TaxID=261658 RepID=F4QCX3_CACFS|nr:uncharacterized protein DFA_12272 [Cavenderia fasciculata]EGG14497.1 hypothetical protein DFA_12272 [Cavenderia fasciculata]|eukprot:XP_004353906.1 hypothetical protein DFA_12272 [Cavenderia fasciculata]